MDKRQRDGEFPTGSGYPVQSYGGEKERRIVYVVEGSSGQWDDFQKFYIAICTESSTVDEMKRKFMDMRQEYKNRYTEEEHMLYKRLLMDPEEEWSKNAYGYCKWQEDGMSEVNETVVIREMELNTILWKTRK